jgi:tetratricopeptide (TPR) repeat protein
MAASQDLDKILELEKEILLLKRRLAPAGRLTRIGSVLKTVTDALIARWVLIALIVGLFVNWSYGVGFFDSIKNIGIMNKSAEYYRMLGDNLVQHAEFKAASDAYARALQINPNNIEATHGLMRAEVLRPMSEGQKFSPVAVEAKLKYLRENIFTRDDYVLLYWEGLLRRSESGSQKDLKLVEDLFQKSISQARSQQLEFVPSLFELANTYLANGKIEDARIMYDQVLAKDPKFAPAQAPLGYCELVLATFEKDKGAQKQLLAEAVTHLEQSRDILPSPDTLIKLGDAYAYLNQYDAARKTHELAIDLINASAKDGAPQVFDDIYVFLPEAPTETKANEKKTTLPGLSITKLDELRMICLYGLAADQTMLKNTRLAEALMRQASLLDPGGSYNAFLANKLYSLNNVISPSSGAGRWFNARIDSLCKGREQQGCKPGTSGAKIKGGKS